MTHEIRQDAVGDIWYFHPNAQRHATACFEIKEDADVFLWAIQQKEKK